jgi:hypothetical protein
VSSPVVVKRIYWESPNASKTKDWPGEVTVQPGPSGLNAKKDFLKSRLKKNVLLKSRLKKNEGAQQQEKRTRWRFAIEDVIC